MSSLPPGRSSKALTLASYVSENEYGLSTFRGLVEIAYKDTWELRASRGHRPNGQVVSGLVREHLLMNGSDSATLTSQGIRLVPLSSDGVRLVVKGSQLRPSLHMRPAAAVDASTDHSLFAADEFSELLGSEEGHYALFWSPGEAGTLASLSIVRVQTDPDKWIHTCPILEEMELPLFGSVAVPNTSRHLRSVPTSSPVTPAASVASRALTSPIGRPAAPAAVTTDTASGTVSAQLLDGSEVTALALSNEAPAAVVSGPGIADSGAAAGSDVLRPRVSVPIGAGNDDDDLEGLIVRKDNAESDERDFDADHNADDGVAPTG